MKELSLHPLSVIIAFSWPEQRPLDQAAQLVGELFDALAQAVAAHEGSVIGHIKGLADLGPDAWLKVSVIAPQRPAQVETSGEASPKGLELATNFMVYGLEPDQLWQITEQVCGRTDQAWSGLASLRRPARPAALHQHHHEPHSA